MENEFSILLQPIEIGKGIVQQWLDGGSSLNIVREDACWRVPLDGSAPQKISEDTTAVLFAPDGQRSLFIDRRGGTNRISLRIPGGAQRTLHEGNFAGIRWFPDGKSIFLIKTGESAWIISPDTGKSRAYTWKNTAVSFPNDLSPDGKATLFVKNRTQAKLILIDSFM